MIDFRTDENGDLVIDPDTKSFAMVSGIEEVSQRIKTTLDIRYGEMERLDPEIGADYHTFLGKKLDKNGAINDITAAIKNNVPEVETLGNFNFKTLPERKLLITFTATVRLNDDSPQQDIEEDYYVE